MSDTVIVALIGLVNTGLIVWTSKNIKKIEVATNSMKDALVTTTREAAHSAGVEAEKARAKAEKASNAAAVIESKGDKKP